MARPQSLFIISIPARKREYEQGLKNVFNSFTGTLEDNQHASLIFFAFWENRTVSYWLLDNFNKFR